MSMTVWALIEYRVSDPGQRNLYGLFTTEQSALDDYGEVRGDYDIEVINCQVFGPDAARGVQGSTDVDKDNQQ